MNSDLEDVQAAVASRSARTPFFRYAQLASAGHWAGAINGRLEHVQAAVAASCSARRPFFRYAQLASVVDWAGAIDGRLLARTLAALLAADQTPMLAQACAEAVASEEQWASLTVEMVGSVPALPHVYQTVRTILQRRMPRHPLALLGQGPLQVVPIFNALHDGAVLRVRQDETALGTGGWLLLHLADPLHDTTMATVTQEADEAVIVADDVPWLDRHRLACPAFVAIAA